MELTGNGSLDTLVSLAADRAEHLRQDRALDPFGRTGPDDTLRGRDDLAKAAKEFEGVFLNTLLKAMRRTVPTNDLFNGDGPTKFYRQMHDAEIAKSLATGRSGMGIADMIVRQLADRTAEPGSPDPQPLGPPAPLALERYRQARQVNGDEAARQVLARLAAVQGTATADTLARYRPDIEQAARDAGLDPALVLAVVMEESAGDPTARSDRGAVGLMQLMPATARELGVDDPLDPAQNLRGGARYLADMLQEFAGRLDVALAAYNAGPGTVARQGGRIPEYPETRRYVKRVLTRYENLGGGTQLASPNP